jgi:Na+/H+-dicarboxylate symporter
MFIVYPLLVWIFGGPQPAELLQRRSASPVVVAFSTASSNATLPIACKVAEDRS